jgi:hypothetical protein
VAPGWFAASPSPASRTDAADATVLLQVVAATLPPAPARTSGAPASGLVGLERNSLEAPEQETQAEAQGEDRRHGR